MLEQSYLKMEVEWPPVDPDDDYYLTVCYVCEEVAKPGQTHMRNYGGTVCFSCRQLGLSFKGF